MQLGCRRSSTARCWSGPRSGRTGGRQAPLRRICHNRGPAGGFPTGAGPAWGAGADDRRLSRAVVAQRKGTASASSPGRAGGSWPRKRRGSASPLSSGARPLKAIQHRLERVAAEGLSSPSGRIRTPTQHLALPSRDVHQTAERPLPQVVRQPARPLCCSVSTESQRTHLKPAVNHCLRARSFSVTSSRQIR